MANNYMLLEAWLYSLYKKGLKLCTQVNKFWWKEHLEANSGRAARLVPPSETRISGIFLIFEKLLTNKRALDISKAKNVGDSGLLYRH
jgi:hypothetical protein